MEKLKIVVLASKLGIDMQTVIDAIEKGELNAEIKIVISDRQGAYALERAKNHNIPAIYLNPENKIREDFDRLIIKVIEDAGKVDLILLIGYMRILSPELVQKYRNKIMNIHPSLLPTYAGKTDKYIHKTVLESGLKVTGCTLHFADEGIDTGPIILQKAVPVEEDDTVNSLEKRVEIAEQEIILKGIRLFMENRLIVEGKRVKVLNNNYE